MRGRHRPAASDSTGERLLRHLYSGLPARRQATAVKRVHASRSGTTASESFNPGLYLARRRLIMKALERHRWSLMPADLDTLLKAMHVLIDQHVISSGQSAGRAARISCPTRKWRDRLWRQVLVAAPGPSITCCGIATARSGTLVPYLPTRPATTSGSDRTGRCGSGAWITWPAGDRPGATRSG